MLHSLFTVVFLLGVAVGALLVGAYVLVYNEIRVYGQSRRGGYVHAPSTEALAAQTDRRTA